MLKLRYIHKAIFLTSVIAVVGSFFPAPYFVDDYLLLPLGNDLYLTFPDNFVAVYEPHLIRLEIYQDREMLFLMISKFLYPIDVEGYLDTI